MLRTRNNFEAFKLTFIGEGSIKAVNGDNVMDKDGIIDKTNMKALKSE